MNNGSKTENPFQFIGDFLDEKKWPFKLEDFKKGWMDTLDFIEESVLAPRTNQSYYIKNDDKESKIYFNVAGIKKNEIKVVIEDKLLKVEFPNRTYFEDIKSENYKVSFKMGSEVQVENIESKLEDGVLVISINKMMDKKIPEKKVIEIK